MARSTGDQPVEGEICYVPSRYAAGTASLFDLPEAARGGAAGSDPVAGRIVLTEGFSMPGTVQAFERRGAIAQIYIHPGERIHEGICTSIWGAPTLESIGRKPSTPVVCINHPGGESLIARFERGPVRASVRTWLREGWMRCLLPVADIADRRTRTSSCSSTGTTTRGTKALATTRLVTRRCSSSHGCCGVFAIDSSAVFASPGGRGIPRDVTRDPPGSLIPLRARSMSSASRSSTSTLPAAPMPRSTRK